MHQELTRERDRSPHAHPDATSPQVHQGKILKIVFKKPSFYYAVTAVRVFRYPFFYIYTLRVLSHFLVGRRQLFLQSTPMGKEIRTENITVAPVSFASVAENSSFSK